MLDLKIPSPLHEIKAPFLEEKKLKLYIKRDDLIHPIVSGNKWRKLKYNFIRAKEEGHTTLLSFGGAYSNHLHALAKAAKEAGLNSIGIIRGDEILPLNSTLSFAKDCGMSLHFITREEYKNKNQPDFIASLHKNYGNFYLIPEGGSNAEGVKGCEEIVNEIEVNFDFICCACGTGTTLSGIVSSLSEEQRAIGFPVLKGGDFLYEEINGFLSEEKENWHLETNYHFGGYGKWNNELLLFMENFHKTYGIELDQIYTGKLMYGIFDLIKKDRFKPNSTLIALHTGGLQGRDGLVC